MLKAVHMRMLIVLALSGALLPRSVAAGGADNDAVNDGMLTDHVNSTCVNQTAAIIAEKCFNSLGVNHTQKAGEDCAAQQLQIAISKCSKDQRTVLQTSMSPVLRIMVPMLQPPLPLAAWAQGFYERTRVHINFTRVDFISTVSEITHEVAANVSATSHAGWIFDPSGVPLLASKNAFVNLGSYVRDDTTMDWNGVLPFFREQASVYNNQIVTVPLDGDLLLLYFRQDVFSERGLQLPGTWEELVDLAAQLNGTDWNADGLPDYGICLDMLTYCKTSFWIAAISAPYIQYQGTSHGLFFDPVNLEPLANNTAMTRALELYLRMRDLGPPNQDQLCASSNPDFDAGRCLMTINWAGQVKGTAGTSNSTVKGVTGVTQLPGSTHVLNRATGTLEACTRQLCPYAEEIQLPNGSAAFLNRAPYSAFGGWVAGVSSLVPQEEQAAAYAFFAWLSSPEISLANVLEPTSAFDPYRSNHFELAVWLQKGYPANITRQFLQATQAALQSSNMVLDIRVPNGGFCRLLVDRVVEQMLAGKVAPTEAAAMISDGWRQIIGNNTSTTLEIYRKGIGWVAPPTPSPRKSSSRSNEALVIAPSVVAGVVLTLVGIMVWLWRERDTRRSLLGKVHAPPAGPDTTLVITDIQDSTALWEVLPSSTMDKALREHHRTVRRLLIKHSGYESATEGDSFTLAFHSARDALHFAVDLQASLLADADWPADLLTVPICTPTFTLNQGEHRTSTAIYTPPTLPPAVSTSIRRIFRMRATAAAAAPPPTTNAATPPRAGSPEGPPDSSIHGLMLGSLPPTLSDPNPDHDTAASNILSASSPSGYTFRDYLQRCWPLAPAPDPSCRLIFKGLRVRVGIHSWGLHAGDSTAAVNPSLQRTTYSGPVMVVAKAVCEAAQGGMVLMTGQTYARLRMEEVGLHSLVLQSSAHSLKTLQHPLELYQVVGRPLIPRVGWMGPIRTERHLGLEALEAPTGRLSIVFLNVLGVRDLMAEHPDATRHALHMLQALAAQLLADYQGYMVEVLDDLLLVACADPTAAVRWSLALKAAALHLPWPAELLHHDLAEKLAVHSQDGTPEVVLFRGLRLKAGIDTGEALGSAHVTTGRITYRGKAVNRAARIASAATAGQVLCSEDTWQEIMRRPEVYKEGGGVPPLERSYMGQFQLKGVPGLMTLYQCSLGIQGRAATGMREGSSSSTPNSQDALLTDQEPHLGNWDDGTFDV